MRKDYNEAINYYKQALILTQKTGDSRGEGIALYNLGSTLLKYDKFLEALEYLQAALEVFRRINSCYYEAEVLNSLAKIYLDLGNHHIANKCCTKGLAIAI